MVGIPSETINDIFKTSSLNAKCKIDFSIFVIFNPYPSTTLFDYAVKNNYFSGNFDKIEEKSILYDTTLNYNDFEKRQLKNFILFAPIISKYPSLSKLIKVMIRFPNNFIYNTIYKIYYIIRLSRVYSGLWGINFKALIKLNKFLRVD